MLTKGAIGNLINRYRAVLNKCRLLNVFGTLAVAGMLVMGGAGVAGAVDWTSSTGVVIISSDEGSVTTRVDPTITNLTITESGKLSLTDSGRLVNGNNMEMTMVGGELIINGEANHSNGNNDGKETSIDAQKVNITGGTVTITGNRAQKSAYIGGYTGLAVSGDNTVVTLDKGAGLWAGSGGDTNAGLDLSGGTINMGADTYLGFAGKSIKGLTGATVNVTGTGVSMELGEKTSMSAGLIDVIENAELTFKPTNTGSAGASPGVPTASVNLNQTGGTIRTAGTLNLAEYSNVAVGNGAIMQVTGKGKILTEANSSVDFKSGSLFDVSAESASDGKGVIQGEGSVTTESGATLRITDGKVGDTYTILDDRVAANSQKGDDTNDWNDGNLEITSSSSMLELVRNPNGSYEVQTADVASALPGLSPELGTLVTGMYAEGLNNVDAPQAGAAFLSRATDNRYLGNAKEAVTTIESAARMGLAVAPQMTWAANNAGIGAVAQRTTLARPQGSGMRAVDANGTPQTGLSSGDGLKSGFGMWIMPLYQHWSANGLSGGGLDLDVKGNLGGVALGADYTINNSIRAGLTFNIGGGEAEGSGDFNDTDNNFSFWGIGAYAGWTYNNFGLTADLNYTQTDNDVEQDMPAAMQMGKLESDIDSRAVSVGLRGEYKIATDALDIIPHAGVRYTWLKTDSYDVSSAAGTVMKGDAVDQDIWTFPVGVAFAKEFVTESGWNVRPSLDLSVIPAAGDLKARGDVRFTGVNGAASVKTEVMDKVTGMGQIGLDFGKDDVSMGLNYSLQAGENTTAHGLFATFRYEF